MIIDIRPRISSRSSYDNTGKEYDVHKILTPELTLDIDKYKAYSPLFLSTTFAISYGLSFAAITGTISHTLLYFRKQLWIQAGRSMHEQPDIHARLMARYKQVPEWWYGVVFGTSIPPRRTDVPPNFLFFFSHNVWIWRGFYRGMAHRVPSVGFPCCAGKFPPLSITNMILLTLWHRLSPSCTRYQ